MYGKVYYWAFEGNEGTGKTSLSKEFSKACRATWTYEPNAETEELKKLRELALTSNPNMSKHGREFILLANRSIHHKIHITPLLRGKETVVTDRSFLSGLVYARLNGVEFKTFMEMTLHNSLNVFPDVIVYCTAEKRKIEKNTNDIYDNADEETLSKIDRHFEEALDFIATNIHTKNIKVLRFENNLNVPADLNSERLITVISGELK